MNDLSLFQCCARRAAGPSPSFCPCRAPRISRSGAGGVRLAGTGAAFDVALHVGSLVALLWYFRAEWIALVRAALSIAVSRKIETVSSGGVILLIIATIPGGAGRIAPREKKRDRVRAPALIVRADRPGPLLWIVDARRERSLPSMSSRGSMHCSSGLPQRFALIPGVSRSGGRSPPGARSV